VLPENFQCSNAVLGFEHCKTKAFEGDSGQWTQALIVIDQQHRSLRLDVPGARKQGDNGQDDHPGCSQEERGRAGESEVHRMGEFQGGIFSWSPTRRSRNQKGRDGNGPVLSKRTARLCRVGKRRGQGCRGGRDRVSMAE